MGQRQNFRVSVLPLVMVSALVWAMMLEMAFLQLGNLQASVTGSGREMR